MSDEPHSTPDRDDVERLLRTLPKPQALASATVDTIVARMQAARAQRDPSEGDQVVPTAPRPSWRPKWSLSQRRPLLAGASVIATVLVAAFAIASSSLFNSNGQPSAQAPPVTTQSSGAKAPNDLGGQGPLGIVVPSGGVAGESTGSGYTTPPQSPIILNIAAPLQARGYKTHLPKPGVKESFEVSCGVPLSQFVPGVSAQSADAHAQIQAARTTEGAKTLATIFVFGSNRPVQRCIPLLQRATQHLRNMKRLSPGVLFRNGRYYILTAAGRAFAVGTAYNRHAANVLAHDLRVAVLRARS